jgi:hypothetical protein
MTVTPVAIREDPMGSIRGVIRRLQEATAAVRGMNADRRATLAMLTAWQHGEPVRTAGDLAALVAAQRQPAPAPRTQATPPLVQRPRDAGQPGGPGSFRAMTADAEAGR